MPGIATGDRLNFDHTESQRPAIRLQLSGLQELSMIVSQHSTVFSSPVHRLLLPAVFALVALCNGLVPPLLRSIFLRGFA
ncbi:MAG TPA: hypothetical protein DCX79_09180 [Planctomycetaceae bacterium]|nr:hypothetical protein [Planctomycetaceae bacterium]